MLVPATSANLGPGFDSFGLALARYDEVSVSRTDGGLLVEVAGVGADEVPLTAEHLVVRAVTRAYEHAGEPPPGLHLRCVNCIPHGGGLGSSAAAIVAGLLLGRELLVAGGFRRLSDDDLLGLANEMEGHPDNVAPALFGGFTLAYLDDDGRPVAIRREVHPDIRVVVFSAHQASSTHHTRGLLPATRDRLHQDYRAPAMPASAALVGELRASGVAAVISGAGPSVIALVTGPFEVEQWRRPGFEIDEIAVCTTGARVALH